jgi:hypothetical protein
MNEVTLHRGRHPHLTVVDAYFDNQHLTEAVVSPHISKILDELIKRRTVYYYQHQLDQQHTPSQPAVQSPTPRQTHSSSPPSHLVH